MPEGENSNNGQGTAEGAGQGEGQQNAQGGQAPPWEGQEFKPEQAWTMIQNLRGERDGLKSERDALSGKVTEFEQANLTETQKLQTQLETASTSLGTVTAERDRLQVALDHGFVTQDPKTGTFKVDEAAVSLLGTGSVEELNERAKQIAGLRQAQRPAAQAFNHGAGNPPPAGGMNSLIAGALGK